MILSFKQKASIVNVVCISKLNTEIIKRLRQFYFPSTETAGRYIENTMFMSFDMKFIRRDQKTRMNDEALPSHSAFSGQA